LTLIRDWRPLEEVTAHDWMRRTVGEAAYNGLWRPLLLSKFGEEHYREVNMAWMWARLYKRTASLGYFEGGFQAFIDLLAQRIQEQGGTVLFDAEVGELRGTERGGIRVVPRTGDSHVHHDAAIATVSPETLLDLAPQLEGPYASKVRELESMGAVALILALERSLTDGHYWINLPKGADIAFMGLVEHTNYISPEHYGGDHLVYCGDYLPPGHPYLRYDKKRLLELYLPGLAKINPSFSTDWVRDSWMFAERYAQPVPKVNQLERIPSLKTPVPNLWMATMSQIYPWDRGSNYAVEMGRRVARRVEESA
jgi:protoporphyrinogen oxidase